MAIAPTGAIYKALSFDNTSSRNYGVYITGEAVYNAPEREVEMISIPGRNGAFALDKGRFENVTVTYPAGIFADNETDFAAAISDFRNYLCSRKGYCRLTDEYNPNEYRMAVYKSGLEVDPAQLRAGEFEITFDCKPQRWLTSGETKQTIANSGDTITNPTLFEASPLLEVDGYGDITLNDDVITIENAPLGDVTVHGGYTSTSTIVAHLYINIDVSRLNIGDAITLAGVQVNTNIQITSTQYPTFVAFEIETTNGMASASKGKIGNTTAYLNYIPNSFVFYNGTADTTPTSTVQVYQEASNPGQGIAVSSHTIHEYYAVYDGADRIDIYVTAGASTFTILARKCIVPELFGYSTLSVLPTPIYIDLDIGEAYGEYSGVYASVNNIVNLPAKLPTLAPGSNTITYDNTITSLKVAPRWWKV